MHNMPWWLASLLLQLLSALWHIAPRGVSCQWEYVTHSWHHHLVYIGFLYLCG